MIAKTRLKEIGEKKGLSQRELARKANICHSSISRYEKGTSMTDKVIKKICKVLDVGAQYFLILTDEE